MHRYAHVNGLRMYYELHGRGEPLLLLHGQFASAGMFAKVLPELAAGRQVVVPEQQGHGHTADIDRPLRFEQMADDTAALLRELKITSAEVFGYSTGGTVALHLAVRHAELVRKLAVSSAVFNMDGYNPEIKAGLRNASPDGFPPIVRESYERVAPDPAAWPSLVAKAAEQAANQPPLQAEDLSRITVPALVMIAEHDVVRIEHAKKLARLLNTKLVMHFNSDHSSYVTERPEVLLSKLESFFGLPARDVR